MANLKMILNVLMIIFLIACATSSKISSKSKKISTLETNVPICPPTGCEKGTTCKKTCKSCTYTCAK